MSEAMTRTVPVDVYVSPAHFDKERDELFRNIWHNVGRVEEIPNEGDYFVRQLLPFDASLIISRSANGDVHAFHNVCSHRGSPVCRKHQGNAKTFVCPFHAWTYGMDGSIQRVPEEHAYGPNFDKTKHDLAQVSVDIWEGFIFVHLSLDPPKSLKDYLGDLPERLRGYPFEQMCKQNYRWSIELNANWKIVRDAFVESHHVRTVHGKTIADQFTSQNNPFSHALILEGHGLHAYMSLDQNAEFRPSPTELVGIRRGLQTTTMPDPLPKGVNALRDENWIMDVNVVFPNFFVDLFSFAILTYRFIPTSADTTRWEVDMYFPGKPKTASERFYHEITMTRNRDALVEDISIVEQIHAGFRSGAKTEIVLHDEEFLIAHLNETARTFMEQSNA